MDEGLKKEEWRPKYFDDQDILPASIMVKGQIITQLDDSIL